jgi:hypothetical protein
MGTVTATATKTVSASPEEVINFLTTLGSRPKILTGNYSQVTVQPDGVLAYHFAAANRERDYRLKSHLTGNTITEQDELSSFVNTWQVSPSGTGASVTLTAKWQGAGGIGGFFEGRFAPLGLKRIYGEILDNLDRVLGG